MSFGHLGAAIWHRWSGYQTWYLIFRHLLLHRTAFQINVVGSMNESEYLVKFQYCWLTCIENFMSACVYRKNDSFAELWLVSIYFLDGNTMFRQTFLLSQYSFILSVQTHNVRNIFLTAGQQNSWLFQQHYFYFAGENWFQKSLWKNCEQLNVGKVCLTSVEQKRRLLRLVGLQLLIRKLFLLEGWGRKVW